MDHRHRSSCKVNLNAPMLPGAVNRTLNTRVIDTGIIAMARSLLLLYGPRKTKSTAAISTTAQKIPIPAITTPCGDLRALDGGTSGIRILFDLKKVSVMAWWYSSFNTTALRENYRNTRVIERNLGKTFEPARASLARRKRLVHCVVDTRGRSA